MSNRYIRENTWLIYDIMHYTEEENIPGLLILVDFEKAFDTLTWKFIQKTLICAEILAIHISKNKKIKGIFVGNTEKNLSTC